jgi:hypothetical protein
MSSLLMEAPPLQLQIVPSIVSAKEAKERIHHGTAPENMRVRGPLDLTGLVALRSLPVGLTADSIDLSDCDGLSELPEGLRVRRLNLSNCRSLRRLPAGFRCFDLNLSGSGITELPTDLDVTYRLDLSDCITLERLPEGLKVGTLILSGCESLEALPENLNVSFLDISGCVGIQHWPKRGASPVGRLRARGCLQLTTLPDWMTDVAQLDLVGCENITEIPAGLRIGSWIDIADTGIRSLPQGLSRIQLRWRGVEIDSRIAFQPETITPQEVLDTANVELRRVLLERMGYEAFLQHTRAKILDRDRDPGGERRLLHVPMKNDEPLVCLAVSCPSTGRQYMLRVPPSIRSCRQAAAWLAGYDDPNDYRPLAET